MPDFKHLTSILAFILHSFILFSFLTKNVSLNHLLRKSHLLGGAIRALTRMEHWWAFHACLQLVSTAKQIFCIFMLGYTTRKWSFPGLWRQWHHRRSPCSAWDVDTAKPWWSKTVAQHFPTSWALSPPLKQAGPSCHVCILYLGQTWDGQLKF